MMMRFIVVAILLVVHRPDLAAAQYPPTGWPETLAPGAVRQEPQDDRSFLRMPTQEEMRAGLRPLDAQAVNTRLREGILPPDAGDRVFDRREVLAPQVRGQWADRHFTWAPSELRTRPVYFEDTMLERHGQTHARMIQPLASGGRFFVDALALPYNMTLTPPRRPVAVLGYDRPGNPVPFTAQRPPWDVRAGTVEAATVVGLIFLIP